MGLIGIILGDIAGSRYESKSAKRPKRSDNYDLFPSSARFTDDTIMSFATMTAYNSKHKDYATEYRWAGSLYPNNGYGNAFNTWLKDANAEAYNSFGNGSAMRAGVLGELMKHNPFQRAVENEAKRSAQVTHNHPEGIKGAQVIAVCTWMLERAKTKEDILKYAIKQYPAKEYEYSPIVPTNNYAATLKFDCTCQKTVPIAIRCFYETENFEQCLRLINSMECDADTIGAMAGCLCDSYYGKCTDHDTELLFKYLDKTFLSELHRAGYIPQDYLVKPSEPVIKAASAKNIHYINSSEPEMDPEVDEELYNQLFSGIYSDEEIEAILDDIDFNASFGIPVKASDLPIPGQLEFDVANYLTPPKTYSNGNIEKKTNPSPKTAQPNKAKEVTTVDTLNNFRNTLKTVAQELDIDATELTEKTTNDGIRGLYYQEQLVAELNNDLELISLHTLSDAIEP